MVFFSVCGVELSGSNVRMFSKSVDEYRISDLHSRGLTNSL
jgi:hypothetical protein